jgi:hypothetical protein
MNANDKKTDLKFKKFWVWIPLILLESGMDTIPSSYILTL